MGRYDEMARVTKEQKEVAESLMRHIRENGEEWRMRVLKGILEENELFKKQDNAQKPTREQMQRRFNI